MRRIIEPALATLPASATAEPALPHHEDARLTLGFANDAGTTRLIERSHFGPLRVQKPLYPEVPAVCHAVIVHPPGGILGGDQLRIRAHAGEGAHAFLTTPGAGKWYRANGWLSQQHVSLSCESGAVIEWLPQETIFFNDANVRMTHEVDLAADARYIGGEILCFGRTASGALQAGTRSMTSPLGLAGFTVCATLLAVGKTMSSSFLQQLREETSLLVNVAGAGAGGSNVTARTSLSGASQIKQVLVLRYLGNSSQVARQWLTLAWQRIRPELLEREAVIPRIWNT